MQLPRTESPLIIAWARNQGRSTVTQTTVTANAPLSLSEIIARHQQAQSIQNLILQSHIVDATLSQHFRPNIADPSFDVVSENRFYVQRDQTEFEEISFSLNGTNWDSDRPAFPLLQAEKVLALPLTLRLNSDYQYELQGMETINDRECFVVRFEPVESDESLYRGTVWIDTETYLKSKLHTVQTRLGAPLLTSEETQTFNPVGVVDGRTIYLVATLIGQQNILIAGRSLLVERRIEFKNFRLNPETFKEELEAARRSDRIMFRDTEQGLRYLVKRNGIRVVDENGTTTAKAMLFGVNLDPSYDYPLPLGGINYLDFDLFGPNSQLAVVFGGVLALINVQRPQLIGERIDGSLDLFAIAVPANDRIYGAFGERIQERILTVPFSTAANIGWRATERIRLLANYQFQYNKYFRDSSTAEDFLLPLSTATNGMGFGLEWKRAGYSFDADWSVHTRTNWDQWGTSTDRATYDSRQRQYQRHSLSLTKDVLSGIHNIHLNAAYYGGRNLDRFSKYQFGFFDEHRVHGVPSSSLRFSEMAMFRTAYSLDLFSQYRAEVAFDHAQGKTNSDFRGWQSVNGLGVGFLLRGPKNTLVRGDIGKSFLPRNYGGAGSVVVQLQLLKPL